ncbi:hypothetical protein [Paraburkholderia unamae]|nr:hypothetical protein [Paraburkholderia unamae]
MDSAAGEKAALIGRSQRKGNTRAAAGFKRFQAVETGQYQLKPARFVPN